MEEEIALETSELTVNYGQVPALWDIFLKIPVRQVVGIIGPNGAGKSTLIKAVLGLVKTLSGKVEFLGQPLAKVRRRIAYIPQRESVDWDFPINVRDLVLMGRYGRLGIFRQPRQADMAAVDEYLKLVGMEDFSKRQISQLSGGQQQRVFLARALIQEADIYLMDEPFTGIDLGTRAVIMNLLQQLKMEGKTVFVVYHELDQMRTHFDWVVMLNIRLVASGPVQDVLTPETLEATYGKNSALFDEALKLSKHKTTGY